MVERHLTIEPAPEGWTDLQLADLCDRVQDSVQPVEGGRTPYVGLEHLASGAPVLLGHGVDGDVTSSKAGFSAGDVLFGKLRPYLRKGAQPDFDGVCSTDILVFRAKHPGTPEYLKYLVHSDEFIEHAKATTSGVQHPRTSWSSLREFKLTLPPSHEQQRIAQVLSTVQQAIEQQERLIRTTTELKQALMQKLFTEGLRGEAQKETEIGLVPESWEVKRLGDLHLDIGDGNYAAKYPRNEEFISAGVAFLRAVNIKAGRLQWKDMRFISPALHETLRKGHVKENDVILVTRGSIGQVAFVTADFIGANMNAQLVRMNGGDKFDGRYLYFAVLHEERQKQLLSLTTGTALQQLPIGKLKSVLLPVPSLTEQQVIGRALALVETKEQDILKRRNTLQDLFRTLLHELMTGKVRVGAPLTQS